VSPAKRREKERERRREGEVSSRAAGARKFRSKFLNITIPTLYSSPPTLPSPLSTPCSRREEKPVFLIARERVSPSPPRVPRPTRGALHHTRARRAREAKRTQNAARALVPPKNGVNNTEVYLFSGINHRELYERAYITQIGTLYQSPARIFSSFRARLSRLSSAPPPPFPSSIAFLFLSVSVSDNRPKSREDASAIREIRVGRSLRYLHSFFGEQRDVEVEEMRLFLDELDVVTIRFRPRIETSA